MNRKVGGDRPARPNGRILAIVCCLPLAACSLITVHTPGGNTRTMNQREFAEYVEHVFRYHNQVVNELIELSGTSDDIDDEDAAELAKEEAHMLQVCASLNDVVSESMTGQDTDFQAKMRLVDAVPECEAATRKVEDLLP
ncbi:MULTISPECIES: hypothetical protein [Methylocaldum]|jgi:hypothetical protein|uniref:hypothetical protein n=1 Tax=unclassified Methylocaldum TaxID=2622260 RepID=UPI00105BBC4D|nr:MULTISPECIES: hypothetical protein [unclassified Methylocaldum]MBP1153009.1 hypothetical protein [Methylocaldum sp. RMAD-M]MDV3242414.1 hypothetical protein [Methylocaldum sp.]MVF21232.1 hypothetical protein [Methylocaldum sp. BRCS4]